MVLAWHLPLRAVSYLMTSFVEMVLLVTQVWNQIEFIFQLKRCYLLGKKDFTGSLSLKCLTSQIFSLVSCLAVA